MILHVENDVLLIVWKTVEEVFKGFDVNLECWAMKWDCSFIDLPFDDWERFDRFWMTLAVMLIVVIGDNWIVIWEMIPVDVDCWGMNVVWTSAVVVVFSVIDVDLFDKLFETFLVSLIRLLALLKIFYFDGYLQWDILRNDHLGCWQMEKVDSTGLLFNPMRFVLDDVHTNVVQYFVEVVVVRYSIFEKESRSK